MIKNKLSGIVLISLLLLFAGNLSAKTQLSLRGGLNMFSVNGSNSDYISGEKDFPVTPAYTAPVFGIGLAFFTSPTFAVGVDIRYGLAAKVDMVDPSDTETVNVETPKNLTASPVLVMSWLRPRF